MQIFMVCRLVVAFNEFLYQLALYTVNRGTSPQPGCLLMDLRIPGLIENIYDLSMSLNELYNVTFNIYSNLQPPICCSIFRTKYQKGLFGLQM